MFVKNDFSITAYAGLVIKTPIATPAKVVIANPTNFGTPPNMKTIGSIVTAKVAADIQIMKKALFTLDNKLLSSCAASSFLRANSSVIIIWSSTPVPTAAKIPAIAAKSNCQPINAAKHNIKNISANPVKNIGKATQ